MVATLLLFALFAGQAMAETPTQFGRATKQLGIEMIAAYSPETRGRSERAFMCSFSGFGWDPV